MRVLLLNHNKRFDGTYYRALPIGEQLALRGHKVVLLTVAPQPVWRARRQKLSDNLELIETPTCGQTWASDGYSWSDLLYRFGYCFRHSFDIIHMFDHKPNATFPAFLGGRLRGARLISDWADWWSGGPGAINDRPSRFPWIQRFESSWETASKLASDGVVTISTVLEKRARDLGCRRVLYLPTGAPLERIRPVEKASARKRVGLDNQLKLLAFVGVSQEDLDIVIDLLCEVSDAHFLLIGPNSEGLAGMAAAAGVGDRVIQVGRQHGPELQDYLGSADVLCLPMKDNLYNRGRLPNKLLDYLAAGRPVLANPIGDVQQILCHHDGGVLAAREQFNQAARELLASPARCLQLGTQARRTAEEAFGWSGLIEQLETFYLAILNGEAP